MHEGAFAQSSQKAQKSAPQAAVLADADSGRRLFAHEGAASVQLADADEDIDGIPEWNWPSLLTAEKLDAPLHSTALFTQEAPAKMMNRVFDSDGISSDMRTPTVMRSASLDDDDADEPDDEDF